MRHVRSAFLVGLYVLPLLVLLVWSPDAQGFRRYQDGCNSSGCHGAFTGPTSTKGSIFPSDNKHTMHNGSQQMNTDCDMCHTSGDNRNPYIGSSDIDGDGNTPGPGCTGCHNALGLRAHHAANGQTFCTTTPGCHSAATAPPENTIPAYYTSTMTNARGPCNDVAALKTNENWTIGGTCSITTGTTCTVDGDCPGGETCIIEYQGLDNDGDNLYDTADPDCAGGPAGAGRVPSEDPGTPLTIAKEANGDVTLTWGLSCLATDDDYGIYEGTITGNFDNHGFLTCTTAGTPTATITPSSGNIYYLIVPNNGTAEGSYGVNSSGDERPQGPSSCATQSIECP